MPTEYRSPPEIRQGIHADASLGVPFMVMNTLATVVAGYGLLSDSTAVVIGAMVIAMLLGPITGIALGLVDGDTRLLRMAFKTEIVGVLIVLVVAFAIGRLHQDVPVGKEILSRTAPSLLDLIIALAGGAAGAYAMASPRISTGLVGVAIATALIPPLTVCGLLLARGESEPASGAFLLFFTNFVAIQFSTSVVLWLLGYHRITSGAPESILEPLYRNAISLGLLVTLAVVLSINLKQSLDKQQTESRVRETITREIALFPDAQLVEIDQAITEGVLDLKVTVRTSREPTHREVVALQSAIASTLQQTVALKLIDIPTLKLDPLVPPTLTSTLVPSPTPLPSATPTPTRTRVPTTTPTETISPSGTATIRS